MGERKIIVKKSAAYQIAGVAFFIASKGLVKTAEKFSTSVYDFIETLKMFWQAIIAYQVNTNTPHPLSLIPYPVTRTP